MVAVLEDRQSRRRWRSRGSVTITCAYRGSELQYSHLSPLTSSHLSHLSPLITPLASQGFHVSGFPGFRGFPVPGFLVWLGCLCNPWNRVCFDCVLFWFRFFECSTDTSHHTYSHLYRFFVCQLLLRVELLACLLVGVGGGVVAFA